MAKVLVIGGGGREAAISYKFSLSPQVTQVFVAPGNCGMKDYATLVDINELEFDKLIEFTKENAIDLVFVGPEVPLCEGIVDEFLKQDIKIFGPTKSAARLEGSKVFSKMMMEKYDIPTAKYQSFSDYDKALAYLSTQDMPIVLKADGLAAGKGVIISETMDDAKSSLKDMMCNSMFNDAASSVVIEEFLSGYEFSLLSFVHNDKVYPMQIAQDHKRAYDNDQGLNTGGMGAYTPVDIISQETIDEAYEKIALAMANAMISENAPFTGILYSGCMNCVDGVKTIEYNVRFGDPEAEVLLLAMENDLYEVIMNTLNDEKVDLKWSKDYYCGVVMASKGYPLSYDKGDVITGLDDASCQVFHMGTKLNENNQVTNSGGRVLLVCDSGETLKDAQTNAYNEVSKIKCDSLFYRTDIGNNSL